MKEGRANGQGYGKGEKIDHKKQPMLPRKKGRVDGESPVIKGQGNQRLWQVVEEKKKQRGGTVQKDLGGSPEESDNGRGSTAAASEGTRKGGLKGTPKMTPVKKRKKRKNNFNADGSTGKGKQKDQARVQSWATFCAGWLLKTFNIQEGRKKIFPKKEWN